MLVRTDRATRACYRTDGGQVVYGFPDSVVHACSTEDVAEVLGIAQRDGIPVTCRGGGLTTEGESVTARGILLDLKDVTLVGREAVQFLARVEAAGVRVVNCPDYVRSWIAAENRGRQPA